jgi:hypothetical protein
MSEASLNYGGPPVCLPMIFPRGIFGVIPAILVRPCFARLDRILNFGL